MKTTFMIALAGTLLLAAAAVAQARIKLTTLPERESVRVDIQNGRYTLVEEERTVNLQAARNQVDFSWTGINIDKDSIVFRVIRADGEVNVLNTNYPPNENALYWTVSAAKAGPAVIRISYLIANMAAEPSYQGIVENDEKKLLMQVYMTVTNTSGESFGETIVQPGWERPRCGISTTASGNGCWPPSSPTCRSPNVTSSTPTQTSSGQGCTTG